MSLNLTNPTRGKGLGNHGALLMVVKILPSKWESLPYNMIGKFIPKYTLKEEKKLIAIEDVEIQGLEANVSLDLCICKI